MSSADAVFDYGPEWRSFSEEDRVRKSRAGPALTYRLHDMGVTSYISPLRDRKLAALNAAVRTHGSERLVRALRALNELCARHGVPRHVCEDAAKTVRLLVKRLCSETCTPGLASDLALAGLIRAAAVNGLTLDWVSEHEKRRLLHILWRHTPFTRRVDETVRRLVSKTCSELGLPPQVELYAMRLYSVYRDRFTGASPRSIAAALVYLAAKLLDNPVTQAAIARVLGISDAALRNTLKKMNLRIHYIVKLHNGAAITEEYYVGKDSYGIRCPADYAVWHSLRNYTYRLIITGEKILVEIEEQ